MINGLKLAGSEPVIYYQKSQPTIPTPAGVTTADGKLIMKPLSNFI